MPTYVYKFIDTGETIEVQQAFTDDALTEAVHPDTGATLPVKKVFLPVGVTFKGGGFYKTDSRNGSSKSSSSTSTDSAASSSPGSSSGSGSGDTGSSSSSGDSTSTSTSTPTGSSPSTSTSSTASSGAAAS